MRAPPVLNLHKALHGRAKFEAICSDVTAKDQETRHIRQGLVNKGHPRKAETFVNQFWHVSPVVDQTCLPLATKDYLHVI